MKDARFQASVTAVGRALRWNPQTYWQGWQATAFGATVAAVIIICIFGTSSGWRFTTVLVAPLFVIQGLGQSYRVYQQRTNSREMSTPD